MSWETALDDRIKAELPELKWLREEPLSRHTSFRIGGPARRMACPETAAQAARLVGLARACGAPVLLLGKGTNLLAPDEGLDRLVIDMGAGATRVEAGPADGEIAAECGASLARVAEFARRLSLTGLEFAHGIPGTLGGGVVMNAGAYGGELKDVVTEVTALFPDGVRTLRGDELRFSYRHSVFSEQPEAVVLGAKLTLRKGDSAEIKARMDELMARRRASQPLDRPSAGSVFKRPQGSYAGTLIESCGLKGTRVGGAEVSTKHAGFIVNVGGATCADVLALIALVQKTVLDRTGVLLEPEIKIVR